MVIDDNIRWVGYEGGYKCDNNLVEGWYRFVNGKYFNSRCVKYYYCDIENFGWLIGVYL